MFFLFFIIVFYCFMYLWFLFSSFIMFLKLIVIFWLWDDIICCFWVGFLLRGRKFDRERLLCFNILVLLLIMFVFLYVSFYDVIGVFLCLLEKFLKLFGLVLDIMVIILFLVIMVCLIWIWFGRNFCFCMVICFLELEILLRINL